METAVKIEEMVKKEPHECVNTEYEELRRINVKEERKDVVKEFEGGWNYHKVKEEGNELESAEEKLEEHEEEEMKPPLLVIVHPNSDYNNDKCEERNIFDEDGGTPEVRDSCLEQERESNAGMVISSMPYSSSDSTQDCKLFSPSSNPSCSSAKCGQNIPIESCITISTQKSDKYNVSFMESHHLKIHKRKRMVHRPYLCDECDSSFTSSGNLKVHKRKHSGEHPYCCDECDASFTKSSTLKIHKMKHTGERPFRCDECDAAFTQSWHLKDHKRTHTGERPYLCDECDASFLQSGKLNIHKRIHTGERPYLCDMCDASFSRSDSCMKHKRLHTGERPFHCEECDASFTSSQVLKTHKKKHTGKSLSL